MDPNGVNFPVKLTGNSTSWRVNHNRAKRSKIAR